MAKNANMIYLYIYMIYLLIYAPNNPPNVGKYGYLYTCTNLIDPIGYGKNMSMCTPKHLIFRVCQQKKMMNWSKLIGQYVPLKLGGLFSEWGKGTIGWGWNFPKIPFQTKQKNATNPFPGDEAVELLGRVKLHPRFMKLESCRGAIFRIPFGRRGEGSWKKTQICFKLLIYVPYSWK